jgi:hypothetical protein
MESGETHESAVEAPTTVVETDGEVTDSANTTIRRKYDWLVAPTLGPERTQKLWTAAREPEITTPTELCQLATPQ